MNISSNNEKLQKYLNELSEEYEELLLKAVVERSESIYDINVSELLRLDNEIKKPLIENNHRQLKRRRLIFIYGLIYMFLGILSIIMYYTIKSDVFQGTDGIILLISIIISVVGLFVSASSFILPVSKSNTYKKNSQTQPENKKLLYFEVVSKWREIEGIAIDLAENSSVSTPRSVIEYLYSNKFIDPDELIILKDFLKIRNNIVHSANINVSYQDVRLAIRKIDPVIEKLRKVL